MLSSQELSQLRQQVQADPVVSRILKTLTFVLVQDLNEPSYASNNYQPNELSLQSHKLPRSLAETSSTDSDSDSAGSQSQSQLGKWIVVGGRKVYRTSDGAQLSGSAAYARYIADKSGESSDPNRKRVRRKRTSKKTPKRAKKTSQMKMDGFLLPVKDEHPPIKRQRR